MALPDDLRVEARVTYPVSELLERIEKRLGSIEGKLEDRATLKVVSGLGDDIRELGRDLGGRLESLESWRIESEAAERARAKYATGVWRWVRYLVAVGGWTIAFVVTLLDTLGVFH